MTIEKIAPPNLPAPSAEYSSRFIDQFTNVLRLYFNRLTGNVNDLLAREEAFVVPISDQTTALTTGTKVKWRMPYAFTVTDVRASVGTAQTSGSILQFDVKESGTSILSTKVTIDNSELTSTTAASPMVISDPSLANDAEISFVIDTVGAATVAAGAVITLIGYQ